ncbi:hypothetical protein P8452_25618 [Trifolium repens]|nr:hypothetical protein P8452_25614 [Trifolium repens]WJX37899.1 hypothetical protein P8452_25618 [Trifolium repens]
MSRILMLNDISIIAFAREGKHQDCLSLTSCVKRHTETTRPPSWAASLRQQPIMTLPRKMAQNIEFIKDITDHKDLWKVVVKVKDKWTVMKGR